MKIFFRHSAWFFLLVAELAIGQTRLLPVDQAATVPDFFTFRAQLQAAIARRDQDFVISALHKNVKLSFGGDTRVEDFKKIWNPSAPNSRLWEVLGSTLALGGTFAPDGSFTAPYIFTQWPKDLDAFTFMAAVGSDIRIRSSASANASEIGTLSFSIVEVPDPVPLESQWVPIKLPSGKAGFVDTRYLRSPIDYRINFAKVEGHWQMMFFLAGD